MYQKGCIPWNKFKIPYIPTLCECGCNEIVWKKGKRNHRFIQGHSTRLHNGQKGKIAWNRGKVWDKEITKRNGFGRKKGCIAHNKGKTGIQISYNKGKKLSEETKNKISLNHKDVSGTNNPRYGKLPSPKSKYGSKHKYVSPLQGEVIFRSSYELAYAKYLDSINELWLYEVETFLLLNNTTYTPDFFLPRLEKFVEIKGYIEMGSKNKFELFKEEYPWDMEILFQKDLRVLGVLW